MGLNLATFQHAGTLLSPLAVEAKQLCKCPACKARYFKQLQQQQAGEASTSMGQGRGSPTRDGGPAGGPAGGDTGDGGRRRSEGHVAGLPCRNGTPG
eukprot:1150979-Pelagomonas_calceolata.AAC.1